MNNPLISVIVPVYKVEAYLEKCVNSIINQTYKNLEIILVDDGSPDKCGEMCDEFAKKDSRIRVFHKENGGQSSARNLGLDNMTGDYVGFVDSDDWIEANMYEHLYELISKNNAQIAACGLQCDYQNGKTVFVNKQYPIKTDTEFFSKLDALRELTIAEKITNSPCDKLFIRNVFDNIRMREGTVFEDFEIMPHCMEKAELVVYDPVPLYHYIMTEQSTTRGTFKKTRFIEAKISRNIVEYYKSNYPELYYYVLARHIEICLNLIQASSVTKVYEAEQKELIKEIQGNKFKKAAKLLNKKNKIKYFLFCINSKLFTVLMTKYYQRNKCGSNDVFFNHS